MIMICINNDRTMVRDYRTAVRAIRKLKSEEAIVEWYKRNGEIDFAVMFQDGVRTSMCSLKDK